jgi:hypothetical protein
MSQRELKLYNGRPVKRMREVRDGILLIFVHPISGRPGQRKTITQQDWDTGGLRLFLEDYEFPNLRKMAAAWYHEPTQG